VVEPSVSLRLRVDKLKKRGLTIAQIARKLGVPQTTVGKASMAGRPPFIRPPAGSSLRDAVAFMQNQKLTPPRIAEVLGVSLADVRPFLGREPV
jgi:hypothetical protein